MAGVIGYPARFVFGPGLDRLSAGIRGGVITVRRRMLGGKIHRATVTGACLDYEGSVTIDSALLEAAGILENEAIDVWNVTTGARLTTYALAGERHAGEVCVNGSAAHHASPGDLVILATFVEVEAAEAASWQPSVVFVDEANRVRSRRAERPHCALEARG